MNIQKREEMDLDDIVCIQMTESLSEPLGG